MGPTGELCPSGLQPKPFLRNPTNCTEAGTTSLTADSWQHPGEFLEPLISEPRQMSDCASLAFNPSIGLHPTSQQAGGPTGLDVDLHLPQDQNPGGRGTPDLRRATVTLPEGMTVNPAEADGLAACTSAQIDLHGDSPVACPDASKIGSVEVETPVLPQPLHGAVYLAKQGDNPFGSLLAIYVVAEGPGVLVKLPGRVSLDPRTARLTTTFEDNPQLPFEDFRLHFNGGERGALINPPSCGRHVLNASLTSWAGPDPVELQSSFTLTSAADGSPCPPPGSPLPFAPRLTAGSASPIAGASSPFSLRLTRTDAEQRLASLAASPPPGLLASLRGIPYCPVAALASIPTAEGTAAAQLATPSCPAASQVGTVSAGAGAGHPFYVQTGRAYLAGPYKGAPLSLAVVVPALAGPLDLGNVVLRTALHLDPETTRITAASDPLPTILHGIPLDLRDVTVSFDRPGFTLNPTSCDEMSVGGTATGDEGAGVDVADRFQVGACGALRFKPRLSLRLRGKVTRTANPRLIATLRARPGEANISRAEVRLPPSALLDNSHIRGVCTRVQYAAGGGGGEGCPQDSVYGFARATTPLLDQPLSGPVYLRSSNHTLPDLVASLDGQIHVDLVGKTDSVDGALRNTFQAVPDAPVSKFTLTLFGGKRGLIEMSSGFCRHPRASVRLDAHSGRIHDTNPVVRSDCTGKARKAHKQRSAQ